MTLVPEPYFISPHAMRRYIKRINPCQEIEAIQQIQLDLQNADIVERFLDKRVYDCISYFALVGPPKKPREQDWPTVITIVGPDMYHPREKPIYDKPNPWRATKIDLWQPTEKHYLRCHWGYIPPKVLARHLGRTFKAIQQQAYRLQLNRKISRRWNEMELEVMEWFYSRSTITLVSGLLGRTKNSVCIKASRMDLANRINPPAWEIDYIEFLTLCKKVTISIDKQILIPNTTFLQEISSQGIARVLSKN